MPAVPLKVAFAFEVLPRFYETTWFRLLCTLMLLAAGWAVYRLRVRQIRYRFALVLDERARLAREIHDTLAQGFVGISSQLDAVAIFGAVELDFREAICESTEVQLVAHSCFGAVELTVSGEPVAMAAGEAVSYEAERAILEEQHTLEGSEREG